MAARVDEEGSSYFRGLALAELLPVERPSGTELAAVDSVRADQVIADLEFVLAASDQFPVLLLRAAHQGLARVYRQPGFTSFSLTVRDGMRLSVPRSLSPAPNVHVAHRLVRA
ncbi:MAG: hypothetical protein WAN22_26790 [Solirubrobacteraceae bacterium]